MKIGYLGAGAWGFCLASLLASKGFEVMSWTKSPDLAKLLNDKQEHPHLKGHHPIANMRFTTNIMEAIEGVDMIVESVTTAGLRPVFESIKNNIPSKTPIVLTSKGIEQNTCLTPPEVALEVLGKKMKKSIGFLSGPSYAQEVIRDLPTSVVGSAFDYDTMLQICETFTTSTFRVYPNLDIKGVSYGGALKNIIAIACGISDGLGLGFSSKAALMTRGLHEIRKLSVARGCKADTLSGLSGMGDICLTCGSLISRNCRFGYLLAQGLTPKEAEEKIEMVVEGAYTCLSALQLSQQLNIQMPITEIVYKIIYEEMKPLDAVRLLMQRTIKEEHL
ncbi:MAG: NAD(P)-dependent glycerol-3-phosphate dehydrogenase [Parachlamydiaceae bacterium]|nr:NAD(P)-dependent glycerol-3-phosphate dehydrogenase [Parachlamydiaceae bacterium]